MPNFKDNLFKGKTGESYIAEWAKSHGCHVLPIYEIADDQFKGPALYGSDGGTIIAPDMAVFSTNGLHFIEAKYKNAFAWYRKTKTWTTGLDLHHYTQYQKFEAALGYPVWILFLHKGGQAKDSPNSPAGLFGESLKVLVEKEHHRSDKWGKSGMVYWDMNDLRKLGDYPLGNLQAA